MERECLSIQHLSIIWRSHRCVAFSFNPVCRRYWESMSSKSSGTHPTFDEEFGSTEIFFGFVLWAVFATLIIVLSLLRQCLQERPVEERRVREIQELIKEGEFEWKPIAASSTADIEEDEMRTQCALCLENFKEPDKVLKLPWYARALIRASHINKRCSHLALLSQSRAQRPFVPHGVRGKVVQLHHVSGAFVPALPPEPARERRGVRANGRGARRGDSVAATGATNDARGGDEHRLLARLL